MTKVGELDIVHLEPLVFQDIVYFVKEISNPMGMKSEMDSLIRRLDKFHHKHQNRVITKVISKQEDKKTITMMIMVPIDDRSNIEHFLEAYDQYAFQDNFVIKDSLKISIPNDMEEFKKAVHTFVEYSNHSDVNEIDLSNNHIIEVSKVDYNGNIVGFDLHMEIQKEDEIHVSD